MANLNIDSFIKATQFIYLATGDKATKKLWVGNMIENGVSPKVAAKVWAIVASSGRVQKGIVMDLTEGFRLDATEVIRAVLLQLEPDGGLTAPLVNAIYQVTGLSDARIQGALNALENEYFIEQRRAVSPWQYIARRWAA